MTWWESEREREREREGGTTRHRGRQKIHSFKETDRHTHTHTHTHCHTHTHSERESVCVSVLTSCPSRFNMKILQRSWQLLLIHFCKNSNNRWSHLPRWKILISWKLRMCVCIKHWCYKFNRNRQGRRMCRNRAESVRVCSSTFIEAEHTGVGPR